MTTTIKHCKPQNGKRVQHSYVPTNVYETKSELSFDFLVPGYNKNDIEIELESGLLHVSAKPDSAIDKTNRRTYQKEAFSRKFKIPSRVKTESISANLENGVLSIRFEKIEPRRIFVNQ